MLSIPSSITSFLSYDPETGHLTWLRRPSPRRGAGEVAGFVGSGGYIYVRFGNKNYLAHRVAWFLHHGTEPSGLIDHANCDRRDNRIANLREATYRQNSANSAARGALRKGVTRRLDRPRTYYATIYSKGRTWHLGSYLTEEEAHAAYCKAALEHFGDFARFE